jgi:spore maturation protein CgeB
MPANDRTQNRLLIVGMRGGTHLGATLERSAPSAEWQTELVDASEAMNGPGWLRRLKWRLMGRTPVQLGRFSAKVAACCAERRPTVLLTTGFAPVGAAALREIGAMGILRINYLTDDPWNPAQRAEWFLEALKNYDHIMTPRRSNIAELRQWSAARVSYLPFGYDPELFFPVELTAGEKERLECDVIFAGGGDPDRVPYIAALAKAGFQMALYGGYWERYAETRALTRGLVGVDVLRKAISAARIALCLVRRANRDGHVMRTFELPAVGACILVEDTEEHRDIFGSEGESVMYFRRLDEMVDKARWLLANPEDRDRLAAAAHRRITGGRNTYTDRLAQILDLAGATSQRSPALSNN